MAYTMTKQGSLDNCVTYEFVCDTVNDMNAIENKYRTIGTVAIVLKGSNDGLEVYIAGSNKQWNSLSNIGGGSSSDSNNNLPTPTVEDFGKYLGVDNSGEWKLSAPSGGSGMFFVESELDESTGTETLNKTFGEIREAVFTNHMGVAITNNNSEAAYFVMLIKRGKVDGGSVVVGAPGPGGVIVYTADTDAEYPSFSYEAMTH